MAQTDPPDSRIPETSGEPVETTGRWVMKMVLLSAAFVLALLIVVVVGKMVIDWVERREYAELAQHSWWEGPMTADQVEDIVARIVTLEADEDVERTDTTHSLLISRSGQMTEVPCRYSKQVVGHSQAHGHVEGNGWDGVVYICVFPGERGKGMPLSRQQARGLLRKLLDEPAPIMGVPY